MPTSSDVIPAAIVRRLLTSLRRLFPGRAWLASQLMHYPRRQPFARELHPDAPVGFRVGWRITEAGDQVGKLTVWCEGTPTEFAVANHVVIVRSLPMEMFLVPHVGALQRIAV